MYLTQIFVACFLAFSSLILTGAREIVLPFDKRDLENQIIVQTFTNLLRNIAKVNEKRIESLSNLHRLQTNNVKQGLHKKETEEDPFSVVIYDQNQKALLREHSFTFNQEMRMDDKSLQEDISKLRVDEGNPLTELQLKMLRKKWNTGCNKSANKFCKKACKSALTEACADVLCKKSLKTKFRKYCNSSCKSTFLDDSEVKDEDDDDDDIW